MFANNEIGSVLPIEEIGNSLHVIDAQNIVSVLPSAPGVLVGGVSSVVYGEKQFAQIVFGFHGAS